MPGIDAILPDDWLAQGDLDLLTVALRAPGADSCLTSTASACILYM
jgi:hypothetical protein